MSTGRAGGTRRGVGSFGAEANRHLARCQIDDAGRNKEWRDLARSAFKQSLVLPLYNSKSADPGTDEASRPLADFGSNGECRLLHRKVGSGDGVVDEVIHLLEVLLVEPFQW